MLLFFIPLVALMAPLMLWPIERIIPYPHIVEELAKGVLIFFILPLPSVKTKILYAILLGFLFGLSENVLYSFNIFTIGTVSFALNRLALTLPLHAITSLLILLPALKDKRLIVMGIIIASLLHYFFNQWV